MEVTLQYLKPLLPTDSNSITHAVDAIAKEGNLQEAKAFAEANPKSATLLEGAFVTHNVSLLSALQEHVPAAFSSASPMAHGGGMITNVIKPPDPNDPTGGGGGTTTLPPVTVTAPAPSPIPPPSPGPGSPAPPSSGPVSGGGTSPGRQLSPYELGPYKSTTAGGHKYSTVTRLTDAQKLVLGAIVDYAYSNGIGADDLKIAAEQAFYESSFGQNMVNPKSNATGLYQYIPTTWAKYHGDLDINSQSDQIKSLFQDITTFRARFATGQASKQIPDTLTFAKYFEIKHHLGPNSEDWTNPIVVDYNDKALNLEFNVGG